MNFKFRKAKTSNGMDIIFIERPYSPMISFQVWVRAGSKYERPGITGISHMIEHMMFKGSSKYGPQEHAKRVQDIGGEFNAFTGHDKTVYYENIAPQHLENIIEMESDRFLHPLFNQEEFLRERDVVMEERLLRTDNSPYGKGLEELFSLSFVAHPYHWPIIGWKSDIASYTKGKLIHYFKERYSPKNIFFVVSGKAEFEEVVSLIDRYFGGLGGEDSETYNLPQEPQQKGNRWGEVIMDVGIPFIFMGYVLPGYGADAYPLISILDRIITTGESSRLWRKLVHEEGIASDAGGGVYSLGDYSIFFLYAMAKEGKSLYDLEKRMVSLLGEAEIEDNELEKARNQSLANVISSLEKSFYTGLVSGEGYINKQDPSYFLRNLDILKKAGKEEVERVWREYLREGRRNTVFIKGER